MASRSSSAIRQPRRPGTARPVSRRPSVAGPREVTHVRHARDADAPGRHGFGSHPAMLAHTRAQRTSRPSGITAPGAAGAWYPPSTWMTSPVMARPMSDSGKHTVSGDRSRVGGIPAERRGLVGVEQGLKVRDATGGPRLQRPRRDTRFALTPGTNVPGDVPHRRLQGDLAHPIQL